MNQCSSDDDRDRGDTLHLSPTNGGVTRVDITATRLIQVAVTENGKSDPSVDSVSYCVLYDTRHLDELASLSSSSVLVHACVLSTSVLASRSWFTSVTPNTDAEASR